MNFEQCCLDFHLSYSSSNEKNTFWQLSKPARQKQVHSDSFWLALTELSKDYLDLNMHL